MSGTIIHDDDDHATNQGGTGTTTRGTHATMTVADWPQCVRHDAHTGDAKGCPRGDAEGCPTDSRLATRDGNLRRGKRHQDRRTRRSAERRGGDRRAALQQ
jgi:hypothetical protein